MRKHISPSATYDGVRKHFATHVNSSQHIVTCTSSGYCTLISVWSLRMGYINIHFTFLFFFLIIKIEVFFLIEVDFTFLYRLLILTTGCPMMQEVRFLLNKDKAARAI